MTLPDDYSKQDLESYYASDHLLAEFRPLFADLFDEKVIYVGCGRGEVLVHAPDWSGCDFNSDLWPLWEKLGISDRCTNCWAEDTPFETNEFDWAVSVDFFEHVPRHNLSLVADEMKRIARNGRHVIHGIAESGYRGKGGETLHPSGSLTADDWAMELYATVTKLRGSHFLASW